MSSPDMTVSIATAAPLVLEISITTAARVRAMGGPQLLSPSAATRATASIYSGGLLNPSKRLGSKVRVLRVLRMDSRAVGRPLPPPSPHHSLHSREDERHLSDTIPIHSKHFLHTRTTHPNSAPTQNTARLRRVSVLHVTRKTENQIEIPMTSIHPSIHPIPSNTTQRSRASLEPI